MWNPTSSSSDHYFQPRISGGLITIGNFIYLFGGKNDAVLFDDLWCFDVLQGRWTEIIPRTRDKPSARFGSASCAWGDDLLIVGGRDSVQDNNDVWVFRMRNLTWEKLTIGGVSLTPRVGGVCFFFEDYLYVYGGHTDAFALVDPQSSNADETNQIFLRALLSASDIEWENAPLNYSSTSSQSWTLPVSYAGLSSTATQDTQILFAGLQLNNATDATSQTTTISPLVTIITLTAGNPLADVTITHKVIDSTQYRLQQAATAYVPGQDTLYVLGGFNLDDDDVVNNGHNGFNPSLLTIQNVTQAGPLVFHAEVPAAASLPPTRRNHRAVYSLGKVWIFGGWGGATATSSTADAETVDKFLVNTIYVYDSDTKDFAQEIPELGSDVPSSRELFSMEEYAGNLIVFGGKTTNGTTNDVWRYSLKNHHWVQLYPSETPLFSPADANFTLPSASVSTPTTPFYLPPAAFLSIRPSPSPVPSVLLPPHPSLFPSSSASLLSSADGVPAAIPPRLSSAASAIYRNYLLVFGGVYEDGSFSAELWAFDIQGRNWTNCTTSGEGPSITAREDARLIVFGDDVVVAGGIDRRGKMIRRLDVYHFSYNATSDVIDFTNGTWSSFSLSLCPITYLGPTIRTSKGFICFPGLNNTKVTKGAYVWDISNYSNPVIIPIDSSAYYNVCLAGGQAVRLSNEFVIFGGFSTYPNYASPNDAQDTFFTIPSRALGPDLPLLCPPGSYRSGVDGGCVLCDYGSYTDLFDQTECVECPEGTFLDSIGGSSADDCLLCQFGTKNNETGQKTCTICNSSTLCPPGFIVNVDKDGNGEYHPPMTNIVAQPPAYELNLPFYGKRFELINTLLSYLVGLGVGLIVGIILFICARKKKVKLWGIDIFSDKHKDDFAGNKWRINKELKKTTIGGCLTLVMIPMIFSILVFSFFDFFLNNTLESKSIVLSNPEGSNTTNTSVQLSRFDVIFGLVDYSGKCNVDNNKEHFSTCSDISFRTYNFTPGIEITHDCKIVDSNNTFAWNTPLHSNETRPNTYEPRDCLIRVKTPRTDVQLFNVIADGKNPTVDIVADDPHATAVSIWGRIQVDSGIEFGNQISNYTTVIYPDNGTLFGGRQRTTELTFNIYPSYYRENTVKNLFHDNFKFGCIVASSYATLGGMVNPPQYPVENGISLRVVLLKSDLFLATIRTTRMSVQFFITNLISNIPSLMAIFALLLFAIELGLWRYVFFCCIKCGCCHPDKLNDFESTMGLTGENEDDTAGKERQMNEHTYLSGSGRDGHNVDNPVNVGVGNSSSHRYMDEHGELASEGGGEGVGGFQTNHK